nr:MAG TPA: hypothetical protein [Caudoviricetes sp.]
MITCHRISSKSVEYIVVLSAITKDELFYEKRNYTCFKLSL